MLEYAVYSVISPEGCASILWKDQKAVEVAATQLKMTATDLKELGVTDEIVPEPIGGAHRDPDEAARLAGEAIARHLVELSARSPQEILDGRYAKYRAMGTFAVSAS